MLVIHDVKTVAELADPERFTGRVWRSDYIATEGMSGLRFVYEPGSRSHWHMHDREQAIVAVHGVGVVAWKGLATPVVLRPGDWWHVSPWVPHWHGAVPSTTFAHLAISTGGSVSWLEEVSNADYDIDL